MGKTILGIPAARHKGDFLHILLRTVPLKFFPQFPVSDCREFSF